jgi:hypothetical protein
LHPVAQVSATSKFRLEQFAASQNSAQAMLFSTPSTQNPPSSHP